jgi:hypothetical protein
MVRGENFNLMIAFLQAESRVHYQSLSTACNRGSQKSQYGLERLRKWPDTRWDIWEAVFAGDYAPMPRSG